MWLGTVLDRWPRVGFGQRVVARDLEWLDPEVTASNGPLVVLLGKDGPDETGDGSAVGEDADDVGAPA